MRVWHLLTPWRWSRRGLFITNTNRESPPSAFVVRSGPPPSPRSQNVVNIADVRCAEQYREPGHNSLQLSPVPTTGGRCWNHVPGKCLSCDSDLRAYHLRQSAVGKSVILVGSGDFCRERILEGQPVCRNLSPHPPSIWVVSNSWLVMGERALLSAMVCTAETRPQACRRRRFPLASTKLAHGTPPTTPALSTQGRPVVYHNVARGEVSMR